MYLSRRFTCALISVLPLCLEASITVHSGATLTVNSGGVLNAPAVTGSSGSTITGGGALNAPVQVDGILEPSGILQTGDLSISNTGTLLLGIDGFTTAGTDYDQVAVAGTVTLSPTSALALGGAGTTLPSGTRITLIQNDGVEPIVGTFNGLEEEGSASLPGSGQDVIASSLIGDGNDFGFTGREAFLFAGTDGLWSDTATWGSSGLPTTTSFVEIGNNGTVTVENPANAYELNLGSASGTGGLILDSTLNITNEAYIGLDGQGDLTMRSGGALNTTNTLYIATQTNSVANISMQDGAVWTHSGNALITASNGMADINLSSGAQWVFDANSGDVNLALDPDSTASFALDGQNTLLDFGSLDLIFPDDGSIDVSLSNGASFTHTGSFDSSRNGTTEFNLTGGSLMTLGAAEVSFNAQTSISLDASDLTISNRLFLPGVQTSSIVLENGSELRAERIFARGPGNFTADASNIHVTDLINLSETDYAFTLRNHSSLTVDSLNTSGLREQLLFDRSSITVRDVEIQGGDVATVQNGSNVEITDLLFFSQGGSFTIQDSGTSLTITRNARLAYRPPDLFVNLFGTSSTMQVLDGASFHHTDATTKAYFNQVDGNVAGLNFLVSGVSSVDATPSGAFFAGGVEMGNGASNANGNASLNAEAGASLTIDQDLYVQNGSDVTFTGAGTSVQIGNLVSDDVAVSLTGGNFFTISDGASVTVTGDSTFQSSDIISQTVGGGSSFTVAGTATIAGDLTISLAPNTSVRRGDSFVLVSAATLSGSYNSITLPVLGFGFAWETTQTSSSLQIEVIQTESSYDIWADGLGLDTQGDGAPAFDIEGDSLENLLEFAFGLSPTEFDANPLSVTDAATFTPGLPLITWDPISNTELTIRMVRLKGYAEAELEYVVESSEDLETWDVQNALFSVISDDGGDYEIVEATIQVNPDADQSKHFGRVGVVDRELYAVTILNHSFEDPVLTDGDATSNNPDWDDTRQSGVFNPRTDQHYPDDVPDGDNCAYMNWNGAQLSQTLSETLAGDTTYILTIAVGSRLDTAFPGYGIELWAGSTLIASDYQTDDGNSAPADGTWKDVSASYTSDASDPLIGETLEIRLIGYGIQTNYDSVRLSAVPSAAVD